MNDGLYIKYLRDRIKADPESRLFLSYAEELKKQDMSEDAMFILKDGTKKNPDFIPARLALGRLYVSLNMLREAKKELMEAAELSPDNFHIHRRLAGVYQMLGDGANAAAEYRKALEINPFDGYASEELGRLEASVQAVPAEEYPVAETLPEESVILSEEVPEQAREEAVIAEPQPQEPEPQPEPEPQQEQVTEPEPAVSHFEAGDLPSGSPVEAEDDFVLAQRFVSGGDYKEAMDIYKGALASDPQNIRALQGLGELKTLLQLSGPDKEALLDRLNKFLEAVHRRFPADDKRSVINKLERFLDAVNMRFGPEDAGREKVFAEAAD